MIVVKLEVWPMGDEKAAREIGRAEIVNIGGDTIEGNYEFRVDGLPHGPVRGRVINHCRKLGAWSLVCRALCEVAGLGPSGTEEGR